MRHWQKQSHILDLWECPDFFELPVDGNNAAKKWVLHGGSSDYFIGTFDGKTFTPETKKLRYTDNANNNTDDVLYAAESFENMPDGRRVQMAWGRVTHEGMPFTQMILFPTEFSLLTTKEGIRLRANPIKEIDQLHKAAHKWNGLSLHQANEELAKIKPQPLHIKMKFTIAAGNKMSLRYQGNEILNLAASDFSSGENEIEILIDKTVAEIFINKGEHYFTKRIQTKTNYRSLEFDSEKYGPSLTSLEVYEMKSIWDEK
jgi:sucrose-6-phosphate hydrolase SacC (GH32 family)